MYQALYRKYRPQTFDEVVGQRGVTETLKAQLKAGKLSHAYLFTGSRGTGKTSCAKILAKAVNCEHPADGSPCNCCAACKSIDSGACMDVLEIDAASNNGVDNVRELRDGAVYTPVEVKKRVYIIDEVHMLSMPAFNALLKTIEEPPEHLLFILATTELHKVPATILSRCQRFSFRRLLPEDIAQLLNYVAYQEKINLQPEAAKLLARLADGAMRDGLSLLDQCAASAVDVLTVDTVYKCLGLAGTRKAGQLLTAAANHDTKKVLTLFSEEYTGGKDVAAMLDELAYLCRDLLVLKTAPKSGEALLSGSCTMQELEALLPLLTAAELLRDITLLQETISGFAKNGNRRIDAELCLMQICDATLQPDISAVNARLSKLEEALASGSLTVSHKAAAKKPVQELPDDLPDEQTPPKEEPAACEQEEQPQREAPIGFWPDLAASVKPELAPAIRGFFTVTQNAPLKAELLGNELLIRADNSWVQNLIDDPETRKLIAEKAALLLKRQVTVRITVAGCDEQTDPMQELLGFGREHSDIIQIEGEQEDG